ncbi:MAG: zinc resistance protein [candidate division BRC1 bacterium ADurb.Bin183]|nr:MAG: zinc resistance protein [candidate division BRC1 bacterium ADurb.Bin183]
MNKKTLLLLIIFFTAFTLVLGAYGFLKKNAVRRASADTGNFEKETLQLTNEQNIKKDELHKKMCADIQPLREISSQKRLELMQLIAHDPADRQAIDAKLKEISKIQNDMQQRIVEHLLEMKKILTPAQQQKLFDTMCDGLCAKGMHSHCRKRAGSCSPSQ